MMNVNEYIEKRLFSLADESYKKFQIPLIPTVSENCIIGVRTPVLRRFARELGKKCDVSLFISSLPHKYYDEDNLHAFLIEQIKDFDSCIKALNDFLPYITNWATCDLMSPKILAKNPKQLLIPIDKWLTSKHTYEVRFGIVSLIRYYLDDNYDEIVLHKVVSIKSNEYYINMARAWFFATALSKQWDDTLKLLQSNCLDTFTHNKTIQKAIESYCVTNEHKNVLRTLKR